MSEELATAIVAALRPEFDQICGELRAAKRDLGQQIDALAARMTVMQTTQVNMQATLDAHTAQLRAIMDRLDRASVPAE